MTIEARITPIWKKQKLFMALFLMAFGGWFFLDGFVMYPRSNRQFSQWREYELAGKKDEWKAYAKANGLKEDNWEKYADEHSIDIKVRDHAYTPHQILGQKICGSIAVALGLILLGYWAQQIGRTLKLDDEGVTSPAGTKVPFDTITGLGLKKWDSKGYAKVRYAVGGRQGEFLIDDYKFEPEPTRKIVDELKKRLEARAA